MPTRPICCPPSAVAETVRASAARAGHGLEADERVLDRPEMARAVESAVDDRLRRTRAEGVVAAVEQRVVDEPAVQVVVLDAIVAPVAQVHVADREIAAQLGANAVGHVVDADPVDGELRVAEY